MPAHAAAPGAAVPGADELAQPASRAGQLYVVDNAGDDLAAVRHINACGGPADGRAVLRPTPGDTGVRTLGWDLLVASASRPAAPARNGSARCRGSTRRRGWPGPVSAT